MNGLGDSSPAAAAARTWHPFPAKRRGVGDGSCGKELLAAPMFRCAKVFCTQLSW